MPVESYKPSKRNWVKLWVDEWLGGTTRFELTEKQRAIWIDLMAMAGKSRYPGIICSGKYEDGYRGYPVSYLSGTLVYNQDDFSEALKVCEKYGKIKTEIHNHDGSENIVIYINNWYKYQSEYLRQKQYDKPDIELCNEILTLWNEQKIIVHKEMNDQMINALGKALKLFSIEDVKNAIMTYGKIVCKPGYWFNYKWSLQEFLTQQNAMCKFVDEEAAIQNYKGVKGQKKSKADISQENYTKGKYGHMVRK